MANIPCDQYPGPGALAVKIPWIGDHFGPANYQQPGETVTASSLGMSGFEWIDLPSGSPGYAFTQSNNYYVSLIFPPNSSPNENRGVTFSSVTLQWFNANNTQVGNGGNLSAEVIRMFAVGI